MVTFRGEPISIAEYACEISEANSTHIIQLDDCNAHVDYHDKMFELEWHEFVLEDRKGRKQH